VSSANADRALQGTSAMVETVVKKTLVYETGDGITSHEIGYDLFFLSHSYKKTWKKGFLYRWIYYD
jgi:hypothetical protein